MTSTEYAQQVRLNRGRLTKFDKQIAVVYFGDINFRDYMLKTKTIGFDKAVNIVAQLGKGPDMTDFVSWLNTDTRTANAIDLKLASY